MDKNKFFSKIPSILWVIIIPLGIGLFIGSMIGFIYLSAYVEGFISIIFLIISFFIVKRASRPRKSQFQNQESRKGKIPSIALAAFIVFFALMGAALDQPGNFIYNEPLEWIFCDEGCGLQRGVDVLHPRPGETYLIQDFVCIDDNNQIRKYIDPFHVFLFRFVEYIIIGYLLYGAIIIIRIMRERKHLY
ncbi:MAG: hypothetical protein JW866_03535 [Ignavibacteriales bacterium]|nr:hypothetical protein [Ignavibacteriales bacterium]